MRKTMQSTGTLLSAICLLLPSLSSCSTLPTPHENFKNIMQSNVGKRADNPSSDISRYPQWVMGSRELPNGNIETNFSWRKHCPVFFEINPATRIIVGWRFEGNERDCEIVP